MADRFHSGCTEQHRKSILARLLRRRAETVPTLAKRTADYVLYCVLREFTDPKASLESIDTALNDPIIRATLGVRSEESNEVSQE